MKVLSAVCDLETLRQSLEPICSRGFLVGVRAEGKGTTESDYDVAVISEQQEEVLRLARGHPLGKKIRVHFLDEDGYRDEIQRFSRYVVLWGSSL
jgi:predicted nucleotidyltransferase